MEVCSFPPLCAGALCGGAVALYGASAVVTLSRNTLGMVTVSEQKCPVVRVLMRGGQVWPAHREVAGENFPEALVELVLNESDEGGRCSSMA